MACDFWKALKIVLVKETEWMNSVEVPGRTIYSYWMLSAQPQSFHHSPLHYLWPSLQYFKLTFVSVLVWEGSRWSINIFEINLLLHVFLKGIHFTCRPDVCYIYWATLINFITCISFYSSIFVSKPIYLSIII